PVFVVLVNNERNLWHCPDVSQLREPFCCLGDHCKSGRSANHRSLTVNRRLSPFPPGLYQRLRLSSDGKKILLARLELGTHRGDLWAFDTDRKIWNRLTSHSSPGGGSGFGQTSTGSRLANRDAGLLI